MADLDDEWKAIAAEGAAARRKSLVPKAVGGLAFAVVFAAICVVGLKVGAHAAEREDELRAQGYEVQHVKYSTHGSSHVMSTNEQATNTGPLFFFLAFGGGFVAGLIGFFAAGGKLSAEHVRGLKQL